MRDNRDLEARPDVLTFTTAALAEALEIIGTPVVELDHTTSNPYADTVRPALRRRRRRPLGQLH